MNQYKLYVYPVIPYAGYKYSARIKEYNNMNDIIKEVKKIINNKNISFYEIILITIDIDDKNNKIKNQYLIERKVLNEFIQNKCKLYNLPQEIIREIYLYDSTYKDIYNKSIKIINNIPKYTHNTDNYYIFEEKFDKHYRSNDSKVSTRHNSYKKAFLIIAYHYLFGDECKGLINKKFICYMNNNFL